MLEIAIITTSVIFNALADRYYPWRMDAWPAWTPAQWRWHLYKWMHFYPPLIYLLLVSEIHLAWKIGFSIACVFIWKIVYNERIS